MINILNLFKKKGTEEPKFIGLVNLKDFIDAHRLIAASANFEVHEVLQTYNLKEYQNLDFEALQEKKIYVFIQFFLNRKKNKNVDPDIYQGGEVVTEIDAPQFQKLLQTKTLFFVQAAAKGMGGNIKMTKKLKEFAIDLEKRDGLFSSEEKIIERLTFDLANTFSKISNKLSEYTDQKLKKYIINVVIKTEDPNNIYFSAKKPNYIYEDTVESYHKLWRFVSVLDPSISFRRHLSSLSINNCDSIIEKEESKWLDLYVSKKGLNIKDNLLKNIHISNLTTFELLDQVQKNIRIIEDFQNGNIQIDEEAAAKGGFGLKEYEFSLHANRALEGFNGIENHLTQLKKLESWEVLIGLSDF